MNAGDISSPQVALAIAGVVVDGYAAPAMFFRRAGENYSEERRCAGALMSIDDGVTLRFAMPDPDRVDFVLWLLPALPGVYVIHRVEVGGEVVADLARRVIDAHERLEPARTPQEVRYASERGRPTIEVDLRGLLALPLSGSTEVLVAIRREASFAAVDRLDDRIADVAAQVRDLSREVGGILLGQGERVDARIAEAQAEVIASTDRRFEAIVTALAAGEAAVDAFAASGDRNAAAVNGRLAIIDTAIAEGRELQAQAMAELVQRIERLQAQNDRLVDAVENVFWRRWLRRLRGSHG